MSESLQPTVTHPVHDPMRDPVVDPVLEPVADAQLDPETDPAARPAVDPGDVDPMIVASVLDVRNRFGLGGLRGMIALAQAELAADEKALADATRDL